LPRRGRSATITLDARVRNAQREEATVNKPSVLSPPDPETIAELRALAERRLSHEELEA